MKKLIIIALLLSGCAGTNFKWDDARKIQPGMTESEVQSILGAPYMVTATDKGQMWIWTYATAFGGVKTVSITMQDGKVTKAPPIPSSFNDGGGGSSMAVSTGQ